MLLFRMDILSWRVYDCARETHPMGWQIPVVMGLEHCFFILDFRINIVVTQHDCQV